MCFHRRQEIASQTEQSDQSPGSGQPQNKTASTSLYLSMREVAIPSKSQAMSLWRRCFTTSAAALNHQKSRPHPIPCSQILSHGVKNATPSDHPNAYDNSEIRIQGFIRSVRKQKRFAFAEISDGSTIQPIQAILSPDQATKYVNSKPPRLRNHEFQLFPAAS